MTENLIESDPSPSMGLSRRILFWLVLATLLYGAVELFAFGAYAILYREVMSFTALQEMRFELFPADEMPVEEESADETAPPDRPKHYLETEVIHPYLGYVKVEPKWVDQAEKDGNPYMGFQATLKKRRPNDVIVAIVGGSVARDFSYKGLEVLEEELKRSPRFSDKSMTFVRLALGGYKQPQQLMTLNYMLILGGEFDLVINIDGFNEIALAPLNVRQNVAGLFPRSWMGRVTGEQEVGELRLIGEITYVERKRVETSRLFASFPFKYSAMGNLLWRVRDRNFEMTLFKANLALQDYEREENSYLVSGPMFNYADDAEMMEGLASVWVESSIQLDKLCRANGIEYFHFLQPTLHDPGADNVVKELPPGERDFFKVFRPLVKIGYPELRKQSEKLLESGINYVDLAHIYDDIEETIYIDTCCHVNQLGNDIMARRIAEVILKN